MQYFDNLTTQSSAQSINHVLKSVEMPDEPLERLALFEDIIIDAFLHTLVGERVPLLVTYLDNLFKQKPEIRQVIKNQLGELGIKALAGVPVVMLKDFDSDIVEASLPGIIPMLLHHLLEVVSDKLESDKLSQLLNIPGDFAAEFALFAYEILGGRPFADLQDEALDFLEKLSINEVDLSSLDPSIGKLIDANNIKQLATVYPVEPSQLEKIDVIVKNPIKLMLLLNLLAIDVATHHLDTSYIWSGGKLIKHTGKPPLSDFGMQALGARYFSVAITEDPGYQNMRLEHAVETRADSILTNYTMYTVISAVAVADSSTKQRIMKEEELIQELMLKATSLIGLANDCGDTILRMSADEIRAEIDKLRALTPTPRPKEHDNPIVELHRQAKQGKLDQTYLALFTLIKDIAKGERNLALDCYFDPDLKGWDNVAHNIILLSETFCSIEEAFIEQSRTLEFKKIAQLMHNFVQYNFQIYALGADYDHRQPIIEQLEIMK